MAILKHHLYLIRYYLSWFALPLLSCIAIGFIVILLQQPVFVSTARVWAKEKLEESNLLRINRKGVQETTFVEVQQQIIRSNRVLSKVVIALGLDGPQPSQSLWGRWRGASLETTSPAGSLEAINEGVRALQSSLEVSVLNPEILLVNLKWNDPDQAQRILNAILDTYKNSYLHLINSELESYQKFLEERLGQLRNKVFKSNEKLLAFEQEYPLFVAKTPKTTQLMSPLFAKTIGDASPLPVIISTIGKLELEKVQEEVKAGKDSFKLQNINAQLKEAKELLNQYQPALTEQAKLAVLHQRLLWQQDESQKRYTAALEEYDKVLMSGATKLQQGSSVSILDQPTRDTKAIAPRKKLILIGSSVLGLFFGLLFCYLRALSSGALFLPSDLSKMMNCPVFGICSLIPNSKDIHEVSKRRLHSNITTEKEL